VLVISSCLGMGDEPPRGHHIGKLVAGCISKREPLPFGSGAAAFPPCKITAGHSRTSGAVACVRFWDGKTQEDVWQSYSFVNMKFRDKVRWDLVPHPPICETT
jgi:hypothetical protein